MFVSTLLCGSKMLNRAFIKKATLGELGFRNRKSTRDDLLLTDFGVRFPYWGHSNFGELLHHGRRAGNKEMTEIRVVSGETNLTLHIETPQL